MARSFLRRRHLVPDASCEHLLRRQHDCYWPGCQLRVAPSKWGCDTHWKLLSPQMRNQWRAWGGKFWGLWERTGPFDRSGYVFTGRLSRSWNWPKVLEENDYCHDEITSWIVRKYAAVNLLTVADGRIYFCSGCGSALDAMSKNAVYSGVQKINVCRNCAFCSVTWFGTDWFATAAKSSEGGTYHPFFCTCCGRRLKSVLQIHNVKVYGGEIIACKRCSEFELPLWPLSVRKLAICVSGNKEASELIRTALVLHQLGKDAHEAQKAERKTRRANQQSGSDQSKDCPHSSRDARYVVRRNGRASCRDINCIACTFIGNLSQRGASIRSRGNRVS